MPHDKHTEPRRFDCEGLLALDPAALNQAYMPWDDDEDEGECPYEVRGNVALVSIDGPLSQKGGWWFDGYESIISRFAHALNNSNVKSIVLRVNSPGGVVAGCFGAARAMREAAVAAGKPVVAYADELACSAAYALSCVADQIVVPPSGMVGSVGVIAAYLDATGALKLNGYKVDVVASGEQKTDGHPHVPRTEAALGRLRDRIDTLAGQFAQLVAERRGITTQDVMSLEAGVFLGADAVAVSLADRVGTLDDAVAIAAVTAAVRTAAPNTSRLGAEAPASPHEASPDAATSAADVSTTENTGPDHQMILLLTALGLAANASEADAVTAIAAQQNSLKQLRATAGVESDAEAIGTFQAWKADAAKGRDAVAKLAQIEGERLAAERKSLLDGAVSERKMTPAERASYDSEPALAALPIEAIRATVRARCAQVATEFVTAATPPASASERLALTDEDRKVAKQLNISEADFLASKRANYAAEGND